MRNWNHTSLSAGLRLSLPTNWKLAFLFLCLPALPLLTYGQEDEAQPNDEPASQKEGVTTTVITPAKGLKPSDQIGPVVLSNMPVSQALGLLQEYSGKVVLQSSGVPDAKLNFDSRGKLRRDQVLFALENLLLLNGITVTQVDEKFIRISPAKASGRDAPPLLNVREEGVVNGEQVFSKIFKLDNLDARTVTRYIGPLVSPGGVGSVINMHDADAVMVIDRMANLEFIEAMLKTIDRPIESRHKIYFFKLDNVSGWEIRNTLYQIRNNTHGAQLRSSLFWVDSRTNSLIVSTPEENYEFLTNIIDELDQEVAPLTTSKVYPIKNANLWTIYRILNGVVTNQQRIFSRMRFHNAQSFDRENQEQGPLMITTDAEPGAEGDVSTQTVETSSPPAGEATSGETTVSGMPELQFSPYISLFPDYQNSSILVYGTEADLTRIEFLLEELDKRSAPMTDSKVFYLEHAEANTIAHLISRSISIQRSAFSREGLRTGQERSFEDDPTSAMQDDMLNESIQFSPFASVIADRRTNALLVYGTREDLRRVEALVKQIDVAVAPITKSKVFYLEQGNAATTASILTRIVQGQQRAMRDLLSQQRLIRGDNPQPDDAPVIIGGDQVMQFSPYVNIVPNTRNNSIVIYGTTSDITQLGELIEMNDIKIAPRTSSKTFFIKHADSAEVVRVINPLIQAQIRVRERESTLRRVFLRGGLGEEEGTGGIAGGDGAAPSALDNAGDFLDTGDNLDDDVQFSPYVSLASDQRSNSVIAYGTPFDLEQIGKLIEQIDRVLPQVRIEVVIAEVSLNSNASSGLNEFGIHYRNPFDPANPGIGDVGINTRGRNAGEGRDPFFSGNLTLNDFSLQTVFRVAREKNNVKVLSAPTITTTHNRRATINVGESRPVITSSTSNFNSNNLATRSEVEYRDIGIELKVRPLISDGDVIQMELEQVVETVVDTQTIDGNIQPIIGTRRATSFVSIRNQEVLVMGGLQSVDSADRDGKVWLLGDVPLVGGLFRPNDRQQTVRELIIFIRPFIVESNDEAALMSGKALDNTAIGEDVKYYLDKGIFQEQELLAPPSAKEVPMEGELKTADEEKQEAEEAAREATEEAPAPPQEAPKITTPAPAPPASSSRDQAVEETEESQPDAFKAARPFTTRSRR